MLCFSNRLQPEIFPSHVQSLREQECQSPPDLASQPLGIRQIHLISQLLQSRASQPAQASGSRPWAEFMDTTGYCKTATLCAVTFTILLWLLKPTCIKHFSWHIAQRIELQITSIMQFSACNPCNVVLNIPVLFSISTIQKHNPKTLFSWTQHLTMQYILGTEAWKKPHQNRATIWWTTLPYSSQHILVGHSWQKQFRTITD